MVLVLEVIVNGYEEIILNDGVSIGELQSPVLSAEPQSVASVEELTEAVKTLSSGIGEVNEL